MNPAAKIELSTDELLQVQDADWILTKQRILARVEDLLATQANNLSTIFGGVFPSENVYPKISKGENYLGLPYRMLDHPALFKKDDVFAIRTMFWWGRFFSVTLLIAGKYWIERRETIRLNFKALPSHFHYCINESPWHHYLEADNCIPVGMVTALKDHHFFKVTAVHPLTEFNRMNVLLQNDYEDLKMLLLKPEEK